MYAIIETGGKQYKVQQGDIITIEKLDSEENASVDFNVIAVSQKDTLKFGDPYLASAKVSGKIIKNGKGKKITVFTYKPKKHCHRKLGHRQPFTRVKIESITA